MAKKQDKITPTRVVSSREAFERKRRGVLATGPSGEVYRLRRLNLERHAFAGGLPKGFAKIATEGEDAVAQLFADMGDPELSEEERKRYAEVGQYLDNLVLAQIVEPEFKPEDLGNPTKIDDDPLLPPQDYEWLTNVALRNTDEDAEGRQLWGVPRLDEWATFREEHGCPEGCEACSRTALAFSAPLA